MRLLRKIINKTYQYYYRAFSNKKQIDNLLQSEDESLIKMGQIFQNSLNKKLTEEEQRTRDKIELLRMNLIEEGGEISATNDKEDDSADLISYLAKVASKKENWGIFLMKLISIFDLKKGLEFGTCIGISAAYQAEAMKANSGDLITMEGLEARKKLSEQNFDHLGLKNIELHFGMFSEILPDILEQNKEFDYLFIDGDHRYSATIENFKKVLPYLKSNSIVVVDDIKWSEGMKRAWKEIKKSDEIAYTFDLFIVGICIVGKTNKAQDFKISLW